MTGCTVALLGTSANEFVIAAAAALRDAGASVTVLVREGREAPIAAAGFPVRTFSGRVAWYSVSLLATLREVGAQRIAVVIGDVFAHANVTATLNWWRAAGMLRGADILLSRSTQPAVLEGCNTADHRQWLAAAALGGSFVTACVRYPTIATASARVFVACELALRAGAKAVAQAAVSPAPHLPVLVDHPRLGWTLRPARITATASAPGRAPRTVRVTIDDDGQRTAGIQECRSCPVIAFYGGSYVFGDALSDEETIPWRAALLFPEFTIRNRATPGYNTLQTLTRLVDDLARQPPAAAVVVLDDSEATRLPAAAHARFPLSERFASWQLVRNAVGRLRASRQRTCMLEALRAQSVGRQVPVVPAILGNDRNGLRLRLRRVGLQWIEIPCSAAPDAVAALTVRAAAAALAIEQPS